MTPRPADAFLDRDGTLYLTDPDALATEHWHAMAKAFRRLSYELPGNAAVRSRYRGWTAESQADGLPGHPFQPDQAAALRDLFLRHVPAPDASMADAMEEKALSLYGTTTDYGLAGYMTRSGRLLDFSHEGRQRDVDHREVDCLFEDWPNPPQDAPGGNTACMEAFMRLGNIRLVTYGMSVAAPPTQAQYRALGKYVRHYRDDTFLLDFRDGDDPDLVRFPAFTPAHEILDAVRARFGQN